MLLSGVVDAGGSLVELGVRESTGQAALDDAALVWMRSNRFEPARWNGNAVLSSFLYKVTFRLEGGEVAALPHFIRGYRQVLDAVEAKDRVAADAALGGLQVTNLYEDAYYHLARYWHSTAWGDDQARIAALRAAIANEKHAKYLPQSTFTGAARALFGLQVRQSDFGAALDTYELFDPAAQAEPAIVNVIASLRSLATDARAFRVEAQLDTRHSWTTRLLKSRFRIEPKSGDVEEFRLHCERDYLFVKVQPDVEYRHSANAGTCRIQIVGSPGARFVLVQL